MTALQYRHHKYTKAEQVDCKPVLCKYRGIPYVRKCDGTIDSKHPLIYRGVTYNQ